MDNNINSENAKDYKITANSKGDDIVAAALEILAKRLERETCFNSSATTRNFLMLRAANLKAERFSACLLDSQHQLIEVVDLFNGTIDGAAVYPREVMRAVLEHNAAAIIFTHNHPSGNPEPSQADIAITNKLRTALQTIDVRVLDHIVTGGSSCTSFAERGLI